MKDQLDSDSDDGFSESDGSIQDMMEEIAERSIRQETTQVPNYEFERQNEEPVCEMIHIIFLAFIIWLFYML